MKRTIQVTIETSVSGRYCGECKFRRIDMQGWCYLFKEILDCDTQSEKRCTACIAAEKEVGR